MTIYLPPSFPRLAAALLSTKEIKEQCRGRYDYKTGGNYCKCNEGELCQVVLAEVLGEYESAVFKKRYGYALEELKTAGILKVRKVKNPPGKPQVFISLAEDWDKKLIEALKKAIEEKKETLRIADVGSPFKEEEG